MLGRALVLAVVGCLTVASSSAVAQRRSADPIEQGIALREQGRDEEALRLFQQVFDESGSPRALAQVALAEQALGRFVEAEAHLQEALARGDDPFIRRNREPLEGALEEIRLRCGDLTVEGGVPGAEILIADVAVGVLPLDAPVRVVAGSVAIEVRAPGYERFIDTVIVRGGNSATVTVELTRRRDEPGRTPPEGAGSGDAREGDTHGQSGPSAPAWTLPVALGLAGVGVVGLGVGAGLMVVREDNARARQTCSDTEPACRSAYQSAVDAEAGGVASLVIGGALVAGGATVLILGMTGALGADGSSAGGESEAHVRCAPGLLSMACAGRF